MAGWVKLPQDTWCDPRITTLPVDVQLLYLRAWGYAAAFGTDGRVDRAFVPAIHAGAPGEAPQRLVQAGLWIEEGDGYRIVRFLDLNLSAAQREIVTEAQRARVQKRWNNTGGIPAVSVRHTNGIPAVSRPAKVKKPKAAPIVEYRPHLDQMSDEELAKLQPAQCVWEYFRMLWFAKYDQDPTHETKHWVRLAALLAQHPTTTLLKAVSLVFYPPEPLPWPLNRPPVTFGVALSNFDLLVQLDTQDGGAAVKRRIEQDSRLLLVKQRLQARLQAIDAAKIETQILLPPETLP